MTTSSDSAVEYYFFPGDIYLSINGVRFDAAWGWVPVIGFGLRLCDAVKSLHQETSVASVLFTESEDQLLLERRGDYVSVAATYTNQNRSTSLAELTTAAREFLLRAYGELQERFPRLGENRELRDRIHLIRAS